MSIDAVASHPRESRARIKHLLSCDRKSDDTLLRIRVGGSDLLPFTPSIHLRGGNVLGGIHGLRIRQARAGNHTLRQ
jgi:hypothetical protein